MWLVKKDKYAHAAAASLVKVARERPGKLYALRRGEGQRRFFEMQPNRCWRRASSCLLLLLGPAQANSTHAPIPHTHNTHSTMLYHEVPQPLHVSWSASPPVRGWWAHRKLRPSQLSSPGTCPHAPYLHACDTEPRLTRFPLPSTHPPYIYHTDSVGERKSVFPPACLPARTHAAASSSSSYPSRRLGTKQPDRHTPTTTTPPAAVMSGRVTRSSSAANAAAGGGNNHPTTSSSSASPPPPPPPPGRPGFPSSSPL